MDEKNKNIENALDLLYSEKMGKTVDNEVVEAENDSNSESNESSKIEKTENLEDKIDAVKDVEIDNAEEASVFPKDLQNHELEKRYIGLLLNEIKAISMYYFKFEECYFTDELLLNIYKKIIFTDGEKYAPKKQKIVLAFKGNQESYMKKKILLNQEYKKFSMQTQVRLIEN